MLSKPARSDTVGRSASIGVIWRARCCVTADTPYCPTPLAITNGEMRSGHRAENVVSRNRVDEIGVVAVWRRGTTMAEVPEIDLPFRWEWRGPDLGPARPADLYGHYPLESLPPVPALDGTLSWLATVNPVGKTSGT